MWAAPQIGEQAAELAEKLDSKRSYWSQDAQFHARTASINGYKGVQTAKNVAKDSLAYALLLVLIAVAKAIRWREEKRASTPTYSS